jgi:hypothetical protein
MPQSEKKRRLTRALELLETITKRAQDIYNLTDDNATPSWVNTRYDNVFNADTRDMVVRWVYQRSDELDAKELKAAKALLALLERTIGRRKQLSRWPKRVSRSQRRRKSRSRRRRRSTRK